MIFVVSCLLMAVWYFLLVDFSHNSW